MKDPAAIQATSLRVGNFATCAMMNSSPSSIAAKSVRACPMPELAAARVIRAAALLAARYGPAQVDTAVGAAYSRDAG
jgi:hypothetical protein